MMKKRLSRIFCALSFIFVAHCAAENVPDSSIYDLNGLITRNINHYRNLVQANEHDVLPGIQLHGFNENIFKFLGDLLSTSSSCFSDLMYIKKNNKTDWAKQLLDSFGKPESGIFNGNLKWIGDYNECLGVVSSNPNGSVGNFRAKYCFATLELNKTVIPQDITLATCFPDTCSADELQEIIQYALIIARKYVPPKYDYIIPNVTMQCKITERHLTNASIAMISLLSFFSALVLIGSSITAVKYFMKVIKESSNPSYAENVYENNKDDEKNIFDRQAVQDNESLLENGGTATVTASILRSLETFFGCFCVFANGAKLLNTTSSEGDLLCIHGIRFLSMSWVILGHTYIFGFAQMRNMKEVFTLVVTFPFQAILQAFFSVDSFFVLSGFLLTFLAMKEFSKSKGKISWPYFYIHRYLRLTPMYMILLGFSASLYLYLGSGPFWPDLTYDVACHKVWWRNLIYINNFDLDAGQCMGWSWYLANDMQFFIISPLFLITLWRWPKIGYALIAIFLSAACLSNFFITYHFNMLSGLVTLLNDGITGMADAQAKFAGYFDKLYVKPYTRIGPYLVGMLTGYILFKRKANNSPKHSLVFLAVGWIIATSATLATVYGLYHAHPNLIARSFYNALSRTVYAAGLSWVIYVCLVGQGGVVNSILSLKPFIPLSRLTYAAYLIHPMVISGYFQSLRTTMQFTHPTIVALFLCFMLVTYALALPVALILESPIVALEKLVRKKFTAKSKTEAVN